MLQILCNFISCAEILTSFRSQELKIRLLKYKKNLVVVPIFFKLVFLRVNISFILYVFLSLRCHDIRVTIRVCLYVIYYMSIYLMRLPCFPLTLHSYTFQYVVIN